MIPDIIIIADSKGESLKPLTENTCQAMLPVVGKPILEHILESLANLKHGRVYIIASAFVSQIESFVGRGERWGCDIEVLLSRGDSSFPKVLNKHASIFTDECIAIDCNVLRDVSLDKIVNQLSEASNEISYAVHENDLLGISYHRRAPNGLFQTRASAITEVEIGVGKYYPVTSLQGYYNANLAIFKSKDTSTLTYRGKEEGTGLTTGAGSSIPHSSVKQGSVLAGICTTAHRSSSFTGTVVLGNEVVIDRNCDITDSIVLDNSYIGSHLTINNAIVWRNTLISMETLSAIELDDPFLLSTVGEYSTQNHISSVTSQLFGLLFLLLSIPLWIFALLTTLLSSSDKLFTKKRLVGNAYVGGRLVHKPYNQYFINSDLRFISQLPLLSSIATGHLRWFGVSLCTQEHLTKRTEAWEFVRDQHPVGLFGPAQLELGQSYLTKPDSGIDLPNYFLADALFGEFSIMDRISKFPMFRKSGVHLNSNQP